MQHAIENVCVHACVRVCVLRVCVYVCACVYACVRCVACACALRVRVRVCVLCVCVFAHLLREYNLLKYCLLNGQLSRHLRVWAREYVYV